MEDPLDPSSSIQRSFSVRSKVTLENVVGITGENFNNAVSVEDELLGSLSCQNSFHRAASFRQTTQNMIELVDDVRQQTFLAPEAVAELERKDPETLQWLQSLAGLFFQVGLLGFYVIIDVLKGVFTSMVMQGAGNVHASSLLLANSVLSVIVGFGICACFQGWEQMVVAIKEWKSMLAYTPSSLFFSIAAAAQILAYGTSLDAAMVKIIAQMRLPLTALMGVLLNGYKYSSNHWWILIIITCSTLVFYNLGEEHNERTEANLKARIPANCNFPAEASAENPVCIVQGGSLMQKGSSFLGVLYLLAHIGTSTYGSLLNEKQMKFSMSVPFYIQRAQMDFSGIFINIAFAFIIPLYIQGAAWDISKAHKIWWRSTEVTCTNLGTTQLVGGDGLFSNWDFAAFMQLLFSIVQAWTGGIVVKKFSAVVKHIGKSVSVVATVFVTELFLKECWADPLSESLYEVAIIVFAASVVFAQLPEEKSPPEKRQEVREGRRHEAGEIEIGARV